MLYHESQDSRPIVLCLRDMVPGGSIIDAATAALAFLSEGDSSCRLRIGDVGILLGGRRRGRPVGCILQKRRVSDMATIQIANDSKIFEASIHDDR